MAIKVVNDETSLLARYSHLSSIELGILFQRLESLLLLFQCSKAHKCFSMRSPNKPSKFYILFGPDKVLLVVFENRFDLNESVEVKALVEAFVELVVVTLRIECD